jgi:hypothetical protein
VSIKNKMIELRDAKEAYRVESSSVSFPPSSAKPSDNNIKPSNSVTREREITILRKPINYQLKKKIGLISKHILVVWL